MKTTTLLAVLASSAVLSGCGTTQTTTTTTSAQTTRAAVHGNGKVRIINGKRYVFVHQELGSNLPGRWVPEDSAEAQLARSAGTIDEGTIQKTENMQGQHLPGNG